MVWPAVFGARLVGVVRETDASSPALLLGPLPSSSSFLINWKMDPTVGLSGRTAKPTFLQESFVMFASKHKRTETHRDPLQIANCASKNLNELIACDDSRMGKPAESWGLAEQMQSSESLFLLGAGGEWRRPERRKTEPWKL